MMTGLEITVALKALGAIKGFYDACNFLWDTFKNTRAFGKDFLRAKNNLNIQYCIFHLTGEIQYRDLRDKFDAGNPEDPATKGVVAALRNIQQDFENCNQLIETYDRKGEHKYIVW
jgi:hypothetical protein